MAEPATVAYVCVFPLRYALFSRSARLERVYSYISLEKVQNLMEAMNKTMI